MFSTLATIDGYDVIADDTGRPVAHRDTRQSANGVAYWLNDAGRKGPDVLARALTACRREGVAEPDLTQELV